MDALIATTVTAPSPRAQSAPGPPAVSSSDDRASAAHRGGPWYLGWRDLVLFSGLVVAAVLVRLPYLWQIPRFTDELQESLWALAIFRGEILPLTAVDSYYGPLWSYLLAAAFHLGGPTELLPRLIATLLAAVGVAVTYLVGRDMAGRHAGVVAALLMLTSAGHIVINSHTARSNSITPLLTTLIVWALYRATRSGNGWLLALAGFLFALALQTHLSVVVFVPGLAIGLLLMRPRLLVSRWIPPAGALFVLGYANMILFNLQNGFWSFVHARALQRGYADGRPTDLGIYFENLGALVESLLRLLNGNIDTSDSLTRLPYAALAVVGLVVLARRGNWLPLAFCLSGVLVFPYFNPRYGPILSGRYLIPLLPFAYLGIAVALAWLAERLQARQIPVPRIARVATVLALVLIPLLHLRLSYGEVLDGKRVNQPLFTLADTVEAVRQPDELVLLDEGLGQENLSAGGTDIKALRFLLEARAIPYEVAKLRSDSLAPVVAEHGQVVAIMDVKKRDSLGPRISLTPHGSAVESASGSSHHYRVYHLSPRP